MINSTDLKLWLGWYSSRREEEKDCVDHHIESKGSEEGREEKAIFEVREDGKSWVYKNLVLKNWGASGFIVHIKGTREEQDIATCYSPNTETMFELLNYLLQNRRPMFSSIAEAQPQGKEGAA